MTTRNGKFSKKTVIYLEKIKEKIQSMPSQLIADRIQSLVRDHDQWRTRECLNLNPAETVMSRNARKILDSDMATRLTEGFPGDKEYPRDRQNVHIDEIEGILITLARDLFKVRFVEWRAVSTSMINSVVFFSLTHPREIIFSQAENAGGNYSYLKRGPPRIAKLKVKEMPYSFMEFDIDVDGVRKLARKYPPKMFIVGGSYNLFPYPVKELREIADELGAYIIYDAAHLGLLVSSGLFQDPLREGADVMTVSTHKIMGGPVGGLGLTNNQNIAKKLLRLTFPSFLQTRDENKYAATAYALSEMREFGVPYAKQMVSNAQALAGALDEEGFTVLGKDRGYTKTHMIFLDLKKEGAKKFETLCQESNILLTDAYLDRGEQNFMRTSARIATHEITRQGMKEEEMRYIANLMGRLIFKGESSNKIASKVKSFLINFQKIEYSFDA
jgi:glycine hydroxymethyltransferase